MAGWNIFMGLSFLFEYFFLQTVQPIGEDTKENGNSFGWTPFSLRIWIKTLQSPVSGRGDTEEDDHNSSWHVPLIYLLVTYTDKVDHKSFVECPIDIG